MPLYSFDQTKPLDFSDDPDYPCKAYRVEFDVARFDVDESSPSTFYGYVDKAGTIEFHTDKSSHSIFVEAGMHFCMNRSFKFTGGAVIIERIGFKGLFSIGGPIEEKGRLKYIDGCSDTLLIGPPRIGDPCLNHLHFPTGIDQTMHTHPTVRVGIVARGNGVCKTPDCEFELYPGLCWYLPIDGVHGFKTTDQTMDIIAWHPDTDTGPMDEDHPMLNRTYVDGTSARYIDDIKTKSV